MMIVVPGIWYLYRDKAIKVRVFHIVRVYYKYTAAMYAPISCAFCIIYDYPSINISYGCFFCYNFIGTIKYRFR